MRVFWYFSIGVFCAVAACGQAIVEDSVATAGASAAAGGLKDTGKSVGGVFRGAGETLDKAGSAKKNRNTTTQNSVIARSGQSSQTVKSVPASNPIDPSQVTKGLDRAELIARFGEPVLRFSETRNSQLVERLWYNSTTSDQFEIRLIDDKVASAHPPANTKPVERHN
jgi:hypothetical protein